MAEHASMSLVIRNKHRVVLTQADNSFKPIVYVCNPRLSSMLCCAIFQTFSVNKSRLQTNVNTQSIFSVAVIISLTYGCLIVNIPLQLTPPIGGFVSINVVTILIVRMKLLQNELAALRHRKTLSTVRHRSKASVAIRLL